MNLQKNMTFYSFKKCQKSTPTSIIENVFINPSPFYIQTPQDQGTGYDNEDEDSDRRYARAVDYMEEIDGNEGNGESKKYYKDWILENLG